MSNPTGIKQIFQSMIPDDIGIIEGVVMGINPLKIALVNDAKIELGQNSLVIPSYLKNHKIPVSFNGAASGSVTGGENLKSITYSGFINIQNDLKSGEYVYLLQLNSGKKYFVLDRKG